MGGMEAFNGKWQEYEIMHGDQRVAVIGRNGMCHIYREEMQPYNLYLESVSEEDIDGRIQNLDNFYHWCASRILTLDREYAKEILNSIGAAQSVTDRDRAEIALSYHCLSLMDIFWTKEKEEQQSFTQLNLFENHLETAFIDVSLWGRKMTQKEAAIEAVKAVGINQSKEVDMTWFTDAAVREMFVKRLALLRTYEMPEQ